MTLYLLKDKKDPFYESALEELKKEREDDFFFFSDETRNYLLLDSSNNIMGGIDAILTTSSLEAEILFIYVKKELRQNGYGYKMLQEFFVILEDEKINEVFIEVDTENKPAISLYNKCGFKNLYTRKSYYKNGHDALVMHKELEV